MEAWIAGALLAFGTKAGDGIGKVVLWLMLIAFILFLFVLGSIYLLLKAFVLFVMGIVMWTVIHLGPFILIFGALGIVKAIFFPSPARILDRQYLVVLPNGGTLQTSLTSLFMDADNRGHILSEKTKQDIVDAASAGKVYHGVADSGPWTVSRA
jgi:hypothetical protein